jgi:hypothetical protein
MKSIILLLICLVSTLSAMPWDPPFAFNEQVNDLKGIVKLNGRFGRPSKPNIVVSAQVMCNCLKLFCNRGREIDNKHAKSYLQKYFNNSIVVKNGIYYHQPDLPLKDIFGGICAKGQFITLKYGWVPDEPKYKKSIEAAKSLEKVDQEESQEELQQIGLSKKLSESKPLTKINQKRFQEEQDSERLNNEEDELF